MYAEAVKEEEEEGEEEEENEVAQDAWLVSSVRFVHGTKIEKQRHTTVRG